MSIEKRVHPIPFRTRKLSASSPMILRIFTWESRPMPRLSLERLLFRSLSSFKGCSHRAALFLFHSRRFPPAFFFRCVCYLSMFVVFRIVDGMTGEAEFLPQAGDGKRSFLRAVIWPWSGWKRPGSGIYGFLPEHEFLGGHNLLHYKPGVFGTERRVFWLWSIFWGGLERVPWSLSHGGIIAVS